jgi:DMSO/TMAO reductase YedYZ molybdopterin-dependent catalytic subunit
VKGKIKKFYILLLILFIISILTVSISCSKGTNSAGSNISQNNGNTDETAVEAGGNAKIIISGLGDDKGITLDELKKMDFVKVDAPTINSNNVAVILNVKGPLLEKVLNKYFNVSQKDISALRLDAGDGYSAEISKEILQNKDIILVYEVDGSPLAKDEQPIRIAIPGERMMYWVKNLTKIEIIKNRTEAEITKIVFLDTAVKTLPQLDFDYYGSSDKAIKTVDLLDKYSKDSTAEVVYMEAADGLKKVEKTDTFRKAFLKITGDDSPAFMSNDLPKGMWVKNIIVLSEGSAAYFSSGKAFESFKKTELDGISGFRLKDVLDKTAIFKVDAYLFTAGDGFNVEIKKEDIENGLIYINDNNELQVYFKGLPKNTSVKNLLTIESVKK